MVDSRCSKTRHLGDKCWSGIGCAAPRFLLSCLVFFFVCKQSLQQFSSYVNISFIKNKHTYITSNPHSPAIPDLSQESHLSPGIAIAFSMLTNEYIHQVCTPSYPHVFENIRKELHNRAALEHFEQLGQALLNHLFNLVVLALLSLLLSTMLLSAMLLPTMMLLSSSAMLTRVSAITRSLWRRRHLMHISTLQIHKDPTFILLGPVLQPQLATHLLNTRFDLLHMVLAMIALAHNDVEMVFAPLASHSDPLFQHILCFFDEEAVQVNRIASDATLGVVFAEYVVARLAIVLVHFGRVSFSFFRELVGARAIAGFVGLVRAVEARRSFGGFLSRKIAEAVILGFCVGGAVV